MYKLVSSRWELVCRLILFLLAVANFLPAQSVANYAVSRTTGITFGSIITTGAPCNSWRYNGNFQQDDNRSNPVAIGFDFWYNGVRYTEVSISTNGYIDFSASTNTGGPTSAAYGYANGQFSNPSGTLNAIAPFYDDLTTQGNSDPLGNSIRSTTTGTAPNRVFTIEWFDMAVYNNTTPSLTYQTKLYEFTGVIEFHYSTMTQGTANFSYTCGLNGPVMSGSPTPAQLKVQQTANTATFSSNQQNNLSAMPQANSRIQFASPVPAAAVGSLTFTNILSSGMTLNWSNWATNEVGYVIYGSTDGINYTFMTQTAANATSAAITGLISNTTYYWRVYAVTEGALSPSSLNGTQATNPGTIFISVMTGNWGTGATWNAGTVPGPADDVIIANGHTVTINLNAACNNLQVGQGVSGILRIGNNNTARTVDINGNVTVNSGASFVVNTASNATHLVACAGNISNAGTIDMATDANSFANITFDYAFADQIISGGGTMTRFNLVTVDKGSSMTYMVDVTNSNFTAPAGFLTIRNGTFRLSSTGALALTPFNTTISILYTARIWMNSATSTMSFTGGNINLFGDLMLTAGTVNVGSAANNGISSNGGLLTVSGGTLNVAGRYDRPNTTCLSRFTMTGGTFILNTIGSTSTTLAPFQMDVEGSQFTQSGGTIIIRREGGTGAQNLGFNCTGGNINVVTGGTLQIGDASTPVAQIMLINTVSPVGNLLVNSPNATAQLLTNALTVISNVTLNSGVFNAANFNVNVGGSWSNVNGTYTAGTNTTTFNGTTAQTISRTLGAENFNHLIFSGAGTKTLASAINGRNLTINVGATLDAGVTGFTIGLIGNWSNAGTYTGGTTGIVLMNGTAAQTIGGAAVTNFRNLTIQNAAGVSLSSNQNLLGTVLLNTGMFTTTGFDFTLVSNVNGTGRIGAITGGNITGDVIQQRFIFQGPTAWRQLAAPVDLQTIQSWNDDIITAGFPGSDFPNMNGFYSVATYNETVLGPKEYGYSPPASINDAINPLRGYFVYVGPLAVTLDVKGPPRKFNQTFALTYTPSVGPMQDGWNMLSNPYPSAIDWDAVGWTRTNTDQVLYIWNPVNNQYASYVGGIGTNGGTAFIPSSQAFWVRAVAASPSVSITENVKSAQDPSYFRSLQQTTPFLLKLKLSTSNGNDETVIRFDGAGTNLFDIGYDALKLGSSDTAAPYFASSLDSIDDYSINTIGPLTSDVIVPLKVFRTTGGAFTISRDSISDMPIGCCIVLEDLNNGSITPLPEGGSYTFTHFANDTSVRFLLHFSPDITTGTISSLCPSSADGKAWASGIGNGPWDYTWKDASGNLLAQHNTIAGTDTLFGLTPGVYTVIVSGNIGFCPQREDTVHVNGQPFLNVSVNISQPVCPSDATGEIYLTNVNGRTGPYSFLWSNGGTDSSLIGIGVGQYDAYVTDATGCTDTLNFAMNSISQLQAAFGFADDTVYLPNPIAVLNYSLSSTSWQWDFGDMFGTSTDANPYYVYAAPGSFNVTLIASDSLCSDTAAQTITLLIDVGVHEMSMQENVLLANTPYGADLFFGNIDLPYVQVQLYTADGKLIKNSEENVNGGVVHVSMNEFATGIYVVRVLSGEKLWTGKFLWQQF